MKKLLCLFITTCIVLITQSQTVLSLYTDSIPNSKPGPDGERSETDAKGLIRLNHVSRPTLTVYPAPKETATGAAVIVLPGGSYKILAYTHEGTDVCKRFNEMGVTA